MAKETKIVEAAPSEVGSTIDLWACFGWDVISSNTVDTRQVQFVDGDTTVHSDGNATTKIRRVETGEKYTSITFQRDKSMRNYHKLVALERKYFSLTATPPGYKPYPPKKFSIVLIILSVVGLFFYVVPGLIFIIISLVKLAAYPSKYKKWEDEMKAYSSNEARYMAELKAKKAILAQAELLC